MYQLLADLRFGLRLLAKSPGWSALIIATLALGVGANTAIFSIVDSVLLRPLDYPNSERLVRLCSTHESVAGFCVASPPDVEDWARESQALEKLGTARSWNLAVGGDEGTEAIAGGLVSGRFLDAFGPSPVLGRLVEEGDYRPGQRNVVVLGHQFWMERFGGSTELLGDLLTIDEESFSIIGVLPSGFEVPELEHVQLWLPVPFDPADPENRNWRGFQAIALVEADHTRAQAETELAMLAERLAREYPETNEGWGVRLEPLHDRVVGSVRSTLWLFLGAVFFVLLIACANIASLLLARSLTRRPELAVRAALGAGRRRLLSQLLTESLLLAGVGGALGLLLAHGLVRVFVGLAPADFPRLEQVAIDGSVLAFTILASLAATLLFGLVPAMRASRLELRSALVRGTGAVGPGSSQLGSGLVVAEVALALVLLIGAGLMLRSFVNAASWERTFDHEHLLSMWLLPPQDRYPQPQDVARLYSRVEQELGRFPSVVSVGATSASPLFGGRELDEFTAMSRPDDPVVGRWFDISPGYFRTLDVPLRKGRHLSPDDRAGAPAVALVNETMARRLAPDGDIVGLRVEGHQVDGPVEIVGVVADVAPLDPGTVVEPEIYWPNQQAPRWATFIVVRTETDPARVIEPIRTSLERLEPDMGVRRIESFDQLLGQRLVGPRFHLALLGGFALVALILALGGTYGVLADGVLRRLPEMGLRMSLGASRRQILVYVLRQGLKPIALGLAVGLLGAFGLTRLLSSLLYGVEAFDPVTFAAVAAALLLAGLAACYVPARLASRVHPMSSLRAD